MNNSYKPSFLYRNSLSIVLLAFMLLFWGGQFFTGWKDHNSDLEELHQPAISAAKYLQSGHFISSTFENWESEFLQMAFYVVLTVSLRQKGSSESKKLPNEKGAGEDEVDREPRPSENAPWPVRRGGIWLKIYSNSLSIALIVLFLLCFFFHLKGSLINYNEDQIFKGKPTVSISEYLGTNHFWFESFQNWQSEFLAVASIVLLSIYLRQKGSPESKPVDAPHMETGK